MIYINLQKFLKSNFHYSKAYLDKIQKNAIQCIAFFITLN